MDQLGNALKKALHDAGLFNAENDIPTHRDSKTNLQQHSNFSIDNNLSPDHSAILFNYTNKINKYTSPLAKVKLYHKANWGSTNYFLFNQLAFFQGKISDLNNVKNPDPINK